MRTLVIPDVHEDLDHLYNIEELYFPKADRVIMLGDFFDTFKERRTVDTCQWILDHLGDERMEWLLGNHDCHYFFAHNGFKCSGYHPVTQATVDATLTTEYRRRFKLCTRDGKFLLSHAGFTEDNLALADDPQPALDAAFAGKFHPAFEVGHIRGGHAKHGGPTWLDWRHEFEPLEQTQVVGHTLDRDRTVRTSTHKPSGRPSYCLDTALHHIAWIHDGNEVEIVTLQE